MKTKTLVSLKLTKTPTDGSGLFEAIVAEWEIDKDQERFARDAFDHLDGTQSTPIHYQHMPEAADPGGKIGVAFARPTDAGLRVVGQLDLDNPMAQAVYERMLLPDSDPLALREFSVGFEFEPAKVFKGPDGEDVIPEARLIEVSVVHRGAQRTELLSIKTSKPQVQGKALETFALQKVRLLNGEHGELVREIFGWVTPEEEKAVEDANRKAEAEAKRAAFEYMQAGPVPMPKVNARMAVVNEVRTQLPAPVHVGRLPIYATDDGPRRVRKDDVA